MSDLINKLKEQHDELKLLFSNVYDYIATNEKKVEFVSKLNDVLAKHIETEDKELYPTLFDEAKTNEQLKTKLDIFAKDWKDISSFTGSYIKKYISGKIGDTYTADTAKLLSLLRQRMIKEEVSLYTEYENIK